MGGYDWTPAETCGRSQVRLDVQNISSPPKDPEETLRRFKTIAMQEVQAGHMRSVFADMPQRLARVIDADGGPTKD